MHADALSGCCQQRAVEKVPWKLLLSKGPVWALILSHFCHNWGTFILLTWMPSYYNQVGLHAVPLAVVQSARQHSPSFWQDAW